MTENKQHTLLGQCIAEFIGTGLLIFFGVGCVAALVLTGASFGQWEISIMWGMGVAIAIYCTAGVSGAHINPAVTIALAAFHGFEKRKVQGRYDVYGKWEKIKEKWVSYFLNRKQEPGFSANKKVAAPAFAFAA